jgi:hypothetical protein
MVLAQLMPDGRGSGHAACQLLLRRAGRRNALLPGTCAASVFWGLLTDKYCFADKLLKHSAFGAETVLPEH